MSSKKCDNAKFTKWLNEQWKTKCGYIMGATGQDPRTLAKDSWFFTQYNDSSYSSAQRAKALYWREHAPFIYDCAGMAEAYVSQTLDIPIKEVNTKARYIYSEWCKGDNGIDMVKMPRIQGVAVFKYNKGSKPENSHHIGYLSEPVVAGKESGDWYVIEAKGVLYGVVRTKLSDGGWNAWGRMNKYMEYGEDEKSDESGNIRIVGNSVNLRVGPGTNYSVDRVAHKGDTFECAEHKNWTPIKVGDKILWVSSKPAFTEIVK